MNINKLFYIPIIGEVLLIIEWIRMDKYPLNIPSVLSGMYQGLWISLILVYLLLK